MAAVSPSPASITEKPDPLRPVTAAEIAAITRHKAFQPERPEDFSETKWPDALREAIGHVRDAARRLNLNVAVDPKQKKAVGHICAEVTQLAIADEQISRKLLKDAAIRAVRDHIGLFLKVRVNLGRHPDLPKVLDLIRKNNGTLSLTTIESGAGLSSFVQIMRKIARAAGDTPERREEMWEVIKAFLAEQAGVSKVEFPGQTFEVQESVNGSANGTNGAVGFITSLRRLGIDLTLMPVIRKSESRVRHGCAIALEGANAHLTSIDETLILIARALDKIREQEEHIEEDRTSAKRKTRGFDEEKAKIDAGVATLLGGLKVAALPSKEQRVYDRRIRELETRYAKPLAELHEVETRQARLEEEKAALNEAKAELQAEQVKIRAIADALRLGNGETASLDEGMDEGDGGGEVANDDAETERPAVEPGELATVEAMRPYVEKTIYAKVTEANQQELDGFAKGPVKPGQYIAFHVSRSVSALKEFCLVPQEVDWRQNAAIVLQNDRIVALYCLHPNKPE